MRRLAALLAAFALCALPVPGALAQGNPFGPIPPAPQPTATPTPAPSAEEGDVSRTLLLGIAGGVAVIFLFIGIYITRDARSHLTEDDRRNLEPERDRTEKEQKGRSEDARRRARAKTKAQKRARKVQRRR